MQKGFTLVELLLVIALILIVAVPSLMFGGNFMGSMYTDDAAQNFKSALIEARGNAMSGKENSPWGVKLEQGEFLVFAGDSYASRDSQFDTGYAINRNVNIANFDEVVFSSPSGLPDQAFSDVCFEWGSKEEHVSFNSEGVIN